MALWRGSRSVVGVVCCRGSRKAEAELCSAVGFRVSRPSVAHARFEAWLSVDLMAFQRLQWQRLEVVSNRETITEERPGQSQDSLARAWTSEQMTSNSSSNKVFKVIDADIEVRARGMLRTTKHAHRS